MEPMRTDDHPERSPLREWHRGEEGRKIAGVCAGVADALSLPVTLVRALFVLSCLPSFGGIGVTAYLILWFLMPSADGSHSGLDRLVEWVQDMTGEPGRRGRDDDYERYRD